MLRKFYLLVEQRPITMISLTFVSWLALFEVSGVLARLHGSLVLNWAFAVPHFIWMIGSGAAIGLYLMRR